MKITRLKANHLTTPVGNNLESLSLTWVVEEAHAPTQRAARVEIAREESFETLVYDSGFQADLDSLAVMPELKLRPRTRYFWRVTVETAQDETATAVSFFETGKMDEPWEASWVTTPDKEEQGGYYLRKTFQLPEGAEEVRVYCAVLGCYELEVNGISPTDEVLLPGYHTYIKDLQTQTFDLSHCVNAGENTIGFLVGNGWYRSRMGWERTAFVGPYLGVRCEVRGKVNGRDTVFELSDASWETAESPILAGGIYDGEDVDARRERVDWTRPGNTAGTWVPARVFEPAPDTLGPLVDRYSPPMRVTEILAPEVLKTPAGETVLDFHQNLTGWFEVKNHAPADATWQFEVGELLQEGNFYRDNLRSARAKMTYISGGREGWVRPHFTYYGFRYVKLEGFPETVDPADFRACVIHSDLERTGMIETSNPKVNRLFLNALWGQRGNFLDVPTDCPQRDERLGWTGDTQIFSGTACFNMDCAAFYMKYMHDVMLEQSTRGGSVPDMVPDMVYRARKPGEKHSSCAWGDVATVVPWTVYLYYGDKTLLRRQYPAMKAWVGYIQRQDDAHGGKGLWCSGFHYADWLSLDNYKNPDDCVGGTDPYYIATAYYAHSVELTLKAAKVLHETADVSYYEALLEKVKKAFLAEYFTPTGRCAIDTQTALVVALHFNLVPETMRLRLVNNLVEKIEKNGNALTTGFVGTPILCRVLSDNGRADMAQKLVLREDYPSWLYEVNLGATTIWERWNSVLPDGTCSGTGMNSMNHYAYGSVVEWFYRNLVGIRPVETAPGFREVEIRPDYPDGFEWVRMHYDSPMGRYAVAWKRVAETTVVFEITVPFGARAQVVLPRVPETVEVNGESRASTNLCLPAGTTTIRYAAQ